MSDKKDYWRDWAEAGIRYINQQQKADSKPSRQVKMTSWKQEWFGQLPEAIHFLWGKWFKK